MCERQNNQNHGMKTSNQLEWCYRSRVLFCFSNKSNLINYQWVTSQNYTKQLYQHIMLCITLAWLSCCCCLSMATLLLLIAWFHETILIVLSFTHDGPLIKEESPYRKPNAKTFQKMAGKECGLILSSHLWGEALCDDTTIVLLINNLLYLL